MADIPHHILTCIVASIDSLVIILDNLAEDDQRSPLIMDKFAAIRCSWQKQQLRPITDKRLMDAVLPKNKFQRIIIALTSMSYHAIKSFSLLEGVILFGHLKHAYTMSLGLPSFLCATCSAVNHCICIWLHYITKMSQLSIISSNIGDKKTDDKKFCLIFFRKKYQNLCMLSNNLVVWHQFYQNCRFNLRALG